MHNNNNNNNNCKIEERRRKVASMVVAQSMTETEIAEQLNVDQSTISRDVKALKKMSQQFVLIQQNLIQLITTSNQQMEQKKQRRRDSISPMHGPH